MVVIAAVEEVALVACPHHQAAHLGRRQNGRGWARADHGLVADQGRLNRQQPDEDAMPLTKQGVRIPCDNHTRE